MVNEITYDAFGNITVESNPEINFRFGYTGRELDEETGLIYYRTRYLDPKTGQFISQDTIGFNGGDTNLYRYVANSPVNYIDPFGYRSRSARNTSRNSFRNNLRNYFRGNFRSQPRPNTGGNSGSSNLGSPGYYNPGNPGKYPAPGVPTTDFVDLYRLNTEEQIRKKEYIEKYGFPDGGDNPNLWKVDPEQLPKPYVTPTCVTTPGASCDVPDERDFAEKVRELIEEINEENERKQEEKQQDTDDSNQGDSCGIGDKDKHTDPQASNEPQSDSDGKPKEASEGREDAAELEDVVEELEGVTPESVLEGMSKKNMERYSEAHICYRNRIHIQNHTRLSP